MPTWAGGRSPHSSKPDLERAEAYVRQGGHFWNSGMFLFQARSVIDALAQHAPDILDAARAAWPERDAISTSRDWMRRPSSPAARTRWTMP